MTVKLYYFHDPMCSWCWGFAPSWSKLKQHLSGTVEIEYVLGGLAPDNQELMPKEMQQTIEGYWRKIEQLLGTRFNYNFWSECQPRRSTYPACRAVIAAQEQGRNDDMITAIQEAYYLRAMNPSDVATLIQLATELNLNVPRFKESIASERIESELQRQIQLYRTLSARGFPSLVLSVDNQRYPVRIDYQQADNMYSKIKSYLGG
ncbi:DsbA family protein [Kangiella shandongensis]|uniref:DsbA family protein n=1 Tax=Kangiella shandongensis TaxID=2763258 RepID=UPI001CC0E0FF|nr:DsbA family protein [Kangiella shandongensis]